MPQTTQRRRRHYVPDPRKSVQLTARDLRTLAIVKKYRFVTSRHILQLVDGSHQKLLKRLRDLMDAAYLLPIRHPAPRLQTGGSRPKVYGISNLAAFALEIDRGTMPVIRHADLFERTSIFRKLLGFAGTWVRGVHTERFGLKHFQVLIITTSPERVQTMVEAFKLLETRVMPVWSAHDFDRSRLAWVFRFADRASYSPDGLLKYAWVDGHGIPKNYISPMNSRP